MYEITRYKVEVLYVSVLLICLLSTSFRLGIKLLQEEYSMYNSINQNLFFFFTYSEDKHESNTDEILKKTDKKASRAVFLEIHIHCCCQ